MTATVRALSVRQPWATLIVDGVKTVENRTWDTTHRGPLAIHAARTPVELRARREPLDHYVFGAVIGVVDLVDVVRDHPSEWAINGCYHWLLASPRRLRGGPVTVRGRLGLFPVELLDEL
jgi:hypothetical protein